MSRPLSRATVRRVVALVLTVGAAVTALLATAPLAEAATLIEPTRLVADAIGRSVDATGPTVPSAALRIDGHIGGRSTAVALTVAGVDYGTTVDAADIILAADRFGMDIAEPVRAADVAEVREAAWPRVVSILSRSGIPVGDSAGPEDLVAAATELGVDIGATLEPSEVDAILTAGRTSIIEQLRSGGWPVGHAVDEAALRAAARLYDVPVEGALDAAEVRTIAATVAERGDAERTARFATAGGVDLYLPGFGPYYVGFHQSASGGGHVQSATHDVATDVLPSRGRGTNRASAVDVVLRPGDDVIAAVSGEVIEATEYRLYGKYRDVRVSIVPDADPSTVVTMLHMQGLQVAVGDRVEAGRTVVADSARTFPFASQIDRFSGQSWGHVHIEARGR